jgi:SAM-dependent methyltransferase
MPTERWKRIWEDKGAGGLGEEVRDGDEALTRLLVLNGYLTSTAQVTPDVWRAYVQAIAGRMGIRAGDRLFEVGCGSGAFLHPFRAMGCVTDGLDYSAGLVDVARQVLPGGRFEVAEGRDVDPRETYDIVLSQGAFLYFPDLGYAEEVLSRMVDKALRGVAVLDVSDAAHQEEALALRRASYAPGEYDQRYAGLEHLYFERSWFEGFAGRRGLSCRVEPQFLPGYLSARYRFNVYLSKERAQTSNDDRAGSRRSSQP